MVSNRLNNVTYVRVVATFMVVAYHSICFYTTRWNYTAAPQIAIYENLAELLNRIDMPAFVFISGYLFSKQISRNKFNNSTEIILYKVKRLLIPYIFWMIVNLIIVPESLTLTKLLNGFNHLWFLPMLLQLFLVAIISIPLWTKLSKRESLLCWACMHVFFFVAYYKGWNIPAGHIKTFLSAFYLGIITEKHHLHHTTKGFIKYILPFAIIIYILSCIFPLTDNPAIRDFIIKTSAYTIIFSVMTLMKTIKDISNPTITLVDKYSMGIYILHHIFIQFSLLFNPVILFLTSHIVIGPLLLFMTSIICSICIASFISQIPYIKRTI